MFHRSIYNTGNGGTGQDIEDIILRSNIKDIVRKIVFWVSSDNLISESLVTMNA